MTVSIPPDLEQALADRARRQQLSVDEVVRHALVWFLQADPALQDELDAWQDVRDEALRRIEGDSP
jgi:hypothetical protein